MTRATEDPVSRVLNLVEELCDAVDASGEDVGGHRGSLEILREIGPAIAPARSALAASPLPQGDTLVAEDVKIWHFMDEKTQSGYGPWVRHSDHAALIRTLSEANAALKVERGEARVVAADALKRITGWEDRAKRAEVRAAKQAENAEARLSAANAEITKLKGALEPFAAVAEYDIGDSESDNDVFRPMDPRHAVAGLIKVGDLRRARSALADKAEGGGK